ncbi:MAG TPA: hypothetical protein VKA65_13225 [Acidimicrobiales bacterium]|jgi:hypothetical protein|nr:hypothetical protein [Acidimicrobiales bacterium]
MLAVHCPRHGAEVLLSARQVRGIEGRGPTLALHYTCHCGHRGTHHPHAPTPPPAA